MGFLRNRVTALSCTVAAIGLTVGGCSGSAHPAVAEAATARATSELAACTSTFLGMSAGHSSGTTTVTQPVNLTNNGTTACVLNGYPGVNVIGLAHGQNQYTWTLRWAGTPHKLVTLQPGATAHFDVVYVRAAASDADPTAMATASPQASAGAKPPAVPKPPAAPKTTTSAKPVATASKSATAKSAPVSIEVVDITITLPNTFTQDQMAWYAQMVLQDKDPHAPTFVTPFVLGAA